MKNDNKTKFIIAGAAAMVALVAVTGISLSTFAAENDAPASKGFFGKNLTEEQKAEFDAKREEFRTTRQAEMQTVRDALDAGDYNAWKTAVGADAPILGKINESNFGKLVEMHKLMNQANGIREELGIERGDMRGDSSGFGGMMRGLRKGGGSGCGR